MAFYLWSFVLVCAVLLTVASPLYQVQGNDCDFYLGNWVVDDSYYPLYDPSINCSFISQGFDCLRNGRPDQEYLKYRWKPSGCDLPRQYTQFSLFFFFLVLDFIFCSYINHSSQIWLWAIKNVTWLIGFSIYFPYIEC